MYLGYVYTHKTTQTRRRSYGNVSKSMLSNMDIVFMCARVIVCMCRPDLFMNMSVHICPYTYMHIMRLKHRMSVPYD